MGIHGGPTTSTPTKEIHPACASTEMGRSEQGHPPGREEGCRRADGKCGGLSVGMADLLYFVARTDVGGDHPGSRPHFVEPI